MNCSTDTPPSPGGDPPASTDAPGLPHRWPSERLDHRDWRVHTPDGPITVIGRQAADELAAVPETLLLATAGDAGTLEGRARRQAERTVGLLRIAGLGQSAACTELESRLGRRLS